jgi:hypothetical protein
MVAPLAIASPEGCQADLVACPTGPDGHFVLPALSLTRRKAAHGPQHVVLETPRWISPGEAVDTRRLQVVSWHVMFMSRGKVGPLRVDGAAPQGSSGKVGVRNGATR